jgi:DNA replication protein DnaC
MNIIAEALQRAVEREARIARPRKVATDADVAAELDRILALGYIANASTVEPVRAYLEGFGLLLTGAVGRGKTFLIQCLYKRAPQHAQEDICSWGMAGINDWYSWWDGRVCVIDDLGSERTATEYGAKEEIMRLVIGHRAERQTAPTHITTNLSAEQISDRYGDRTLSRILGMCRPFTLTGRDWRIDKHPERAAK